MTYNEFRNRISSLLLYDDDNIDDESDSMIDQLIRSWMAELQYYVDNFKVGNENSYGPDDVTEKCNGAIIDLPSALEQLVSVSLIQQPDEDAEDLTCTKTIDLSPVRWENSEDVLEGKGCFTYSIDNRATQLYINPAPKTYEDRDDDSLVVVWEGVKTDYEAEDSVPFGLDTVKNCADYVNAEMARKKEDKLSRYNSFYESYVRGRTRIYSAQRSKSRQRT